MLSDRLSQVTIDNLISKVRHLDNGLVHCSVLASVFNIFTMNMSVTIPNKFTYADDMALVTKRKSVRSTKLIIGNDLLHFGKLHRSGRLTHNTNKTECTSIHCSNKQTNQQPGIHRNGTILIQNFTPKVFEIILGRTLFSQERSRLRYVQKILSFINCVAALGE